MPKLSELLSKEQKQEMLERVEEKDEEEAKEGEAPKFSYGNQGYRLKYGRRNKGTQQQ